MKRRNFLKALGTLPAITLLPTTIQASESISDGSNVVGLNKIVTIIQNDKRLNRRVDASDIEIAINSVKRMNEIIIEAIIQKGLGNDKKISTADAREINDYIYHNYKEEWIELHGDDEEDEETGFHLVVNDGARTKLFGRNAINGVADRVYHLGFETHLKNRLLNEDGNKNASFRRVAEWLDALLREDLEAGRLMNPEVQEVVGTTDTGLDRAVEIIYTDKRLGRKISTGDMRIGASSANRMSTLILEAIDATSAGASGQYTKEDMKRVNNYLVENYAEEWIEVHGDDEDDEESGYHKVRADGAKTKIFGKNAINRVFDGIFHLGFETPYKNRLVNEDGDKNVSFKRVAEWLTKLLADELNNSKEDLKILIPLYSYPNWNKDNYVWQELIDLKTKYPDMEITAIVNPSNGDFSEKNSDYTRGIQDLISAKINVVGYVYTQYGNRATDEVVENLQAWKEFYKEEGISGIFFDETSTDLNKLDYYTNLTSEARARGFEFTILNPGITTNQAYIDSGIASLVVSYENPSNNLLSNPPVNFNIPSDSTELSLLVYEMENDNVEEFIGFAREHKFSYIYFTEDGFDGNPWDSVSTYLDAEIVGGRS